MTRFLFVFGYESPAEYTTNAKEGTDFESSNAVWVRAASEDYALQKGRDYAARFVGQQFEQAGVVDFPGWIEGGFAHWTHWIARKPLEFSGVALETLDEI
jgi:hypothetical protein